MSEDFESVVVGVKLDANDVDQAAQDMVEPLLELIKQHVVKALRHTHGGVDAHAEAYSQALIDSTAAAITCAFRIGVEWGRDHDRHERVQHPSEN